MTRDELESELATLLIVGKVSDVMAAVDKYTATERHVIEQQITGHVETRIAAERERIAQEIEALTPGWITRSEAARIARAES